MNMDKMIKTPFLVLCCAVLMVLYACENKQNPKAIFEVSEIDHRLDLIVNRIAKGELPAITKDLLLAGLTLDPQYTRRFTNYSGDQEGRYLSAMSLIDPERHSIDIHDLVDAFIAEQKADGRFGNEKLVFEASQIEGDHMALLWGNGRLLTGLMDYYAAFPDAEPVLVSAEKLAAFLMGVTTAATQPNVIERFQTMGALGFICFTQITEGMVKLFEATGKDIYRDAATQTYPLLPDFGSQHSHGFLNTLRGVVMLYEATKNPVHLHYAETVFDRLVQSNNYLVTGGIPEFFSFHEAAEGIRDEGCSEADFFILCLQLWYATDKMKYLDQAEYSFMNHMLYNQFASGDFGHHVIKPGFGFVTAPTPGKSWWCCNYHGVHALHDAQQAVMTGDADEVRINLFYPASMEYDGFSVEMVKVKDDVPRYLIEMSVSGKTDFRLLIRKPYWINDMNISLNGKQINPPEEGGYFVIDHAWKNADKIEFRLMPALRLLDNNLDEIPLTSIDGEPVHAAMVYGPWLMSVDEVSQDLFMTELSLGNIIYIPDDIRPKVVDGDLVPTETFNPESYLSFEFLKEGTSQTGQVILRPLSEVTFQAPSNVRFWLNFARKP